MKKRLLLIILILTCSRLIFAQAPQGLNYQAVAYDASGNPVANQSVSVRLSILDGSATGTLVYQETQNPLPACGKAGSLFDILRFGTKLHYLKRDLSERRIDTRMKRMNSSGVGAD